MTTPYAVDRLDEQVQELLVAHGAERAALNVAQYKGRPAAFAEEVLDFHPYPKQRELLEAPLTHKFTTARGAHATGKDATLACLLLYYAYVEGSLCLALSATERQLLNQLWVEVRRRFVASKLPGVLYAASLEIGGVKRILAMTSGSTSNLTGFHDKGGVFIGISEGQGEQVEAAAYDAAIANATDDLSRVVAVGNPVLCVGRFYEIHQKAHWHSLAFSALDHPNVKEGRVVIGGGPSAQWVEEVGREYGTTSAYFTSRVLGEFPADGGFDALIDRASIDRAFARFADPLFVMRANASRRRIAVDVARSVGGDATAVVIARGPLVESFELRHEPDLMKTASYLHAKALELGRLEVMRARPLPEVVFAARASITVDDAGLGGGVVDRLRELNARVTAFNGASQASEPAKQKFANKRAESYFGLREKLLRDSIAIAPDEQFAEELLATTFTQTSNGRIIITPKDEIRGRLGGRSPDKADAVSMLFTPTREVRRGHYSVGHGGLVLNWD